MDAAALALLDIMRADQAEDRGAVAGTSEYDALRSRDRERRTRAETLLDQADPSNPEALYAAAWLFNHGDRPEEAARAHALAVRAADLGLGRARWLAAAALDRSLMYSGRPQKYGTNMVPDGRRVRLWDVDPATTDEERARWDVPTLAELEHRAAEISRTERQPDLASAPEWLRQALDRRRAEDGA